MAELGSGGMGSVWHVRTTDAAEWELALKVIRSFGEMSPEAIERFYKRLHWANGQARRP